jgi:hypothetical protein
VGLVDPCVAEEVMLGGVSISGENSLFTVMSEYALFCRLALLVAVTLNVIFGVAVGVFNNPVALIVPNVVDHVTAVSVLLVTVALNC